MSILVRGKYLITDARLEEKGILNDCGVYIENDEITEIDDFCKLRDKYPHAKVVGNGKQLVMPGLIDAHTHGQGLSYFEEGFKYDYLENCILEWALSRDTELATMLNAVRHIQNGCTTTHHNDRGKPFDKDALVKAKKKIEGYRSAGIRLAYSPAVKNINSVALEDKEFYKTLPSDMQEFVKPMIFIDHDKVVDDYLELFSSLYDNYNSKDLKIIFGPSWAQGSTDEFLLRVKEKSDELGGIPIHIHTLQTPIQKAFGLRNYGKSLLMHLNDLGLVDENLVLGHAVHLNEDDISLLAEKNASTTHHPTCNFLMRNGISPVYYLLKQGVNVALGIDGKGISDDEDIIMEMRMAFLLHRIPKYDLENAPTLTAFDIIKMATLNSARACGFDDIGAIKVGNKGDLILIDLERITENPWISPNLNIAEIFIHKAKGVDVNTVVIGGEVIMEDRKILTIDVDSLYKEIRKDMNKGFSKEQLDYAAKMQLLKPYYQRWYRDWVDNDDFKPYYNLNNRE